MTDGRTDQSIGSPTQPWGRTRPHGTVLALRGDMATDNPKLKAGRVCERCGEGHLAVVVKSSVTAYVICDQCHTVWAPPRPALDGQGPITSVNPEVSP